MNVNKILTHIPISFSPGQQGTPWEEEVLRKEGKREEVRQSETLQALDAQREVRAGWYPRFFGLWKGRQMAC